MRPFRPLLRRRDRLTAAKKTSRRGKTTGRRKPVTIRQLSDLPALIDDAAGVSVRMRGLKPDQPMGFGGVWGGIRALLAAAIARSTPHILMLLPQAADAEIVATDARSFGLTDAVALPLSAGDGSGATIRDVDFADRLQVLQRLRSRDADSPEPLLVTAFIGAAIQKVPTPQKLADSTRTLKVGQTLAPEDVRAWLAEAGFAGTTAVQFPGEFATRGGLLDIYSPDQPLPIRVEWFGDEIESIRTFDLSSQRSIESVTEIELAAIGASTADPLDETPAMPPEQQGPISDYLPADTVVVVVDPQGCASSADALLRRVVDPSRFVTMDELIASMTSHRVVTADDFPEATGDELLSLDTASADSFASELSETQKKVDTIAADHHVIVVGDTPADGQRLTELLQPTRAAAEGRLHMTVADLSGGFRLPSAGALVLTGAELFHRSPVRRGKTRARGKPIQNFLQLQVGDLVVHLSHGIGLYRGLRQIEKNGQHVEHLTIEYDGGTKIYVPASRIGLVQKYIGGSKTRPRLAKIGGQAWANHRKAAESAVTDMAAELIEMQAQRQARRGISFAPDNTWQQQFDASFPYTETPDQLAAIEAIKDDMESARPMDRLICGDVGFGKTEVAMRAAFKAVTSGYQVAVLVPTTVLAEQHYNTFRERMAEFPIEIAKLSRFVSPADTRATVKRIASGEADIIVGTHRIAGKDVRFANLGLVIVDEEQRFGVEVKERLKNHRNNVDVLTLSATPIPRTLHMALVGVRDISNLETPPAERMSVETKVTRWDDKMVRSAMVRELNRGGQMFFVHNRIGDMHELADRLRNIVPELRIGIGHGQMGEGELEQVMIDFIDHKFDLLLATTIVESGIDIANANTMFIDEGDKYGLSDLHQLRGRVGRYKHQAYCYLLVSRRKHLSPEASKRLRAIEDYSQMGAGFAIAMRDLEIRGAGNLLGSQQSGHIAAVGYELYCHLLEDAVRQAQKLPPKLSADVDIDLPVEAYLPDEYVPDLRHKIDLYRRMAKIDNVAKINEIKEELVDRFGPIPQPAERMLQLVELRLDAAAWQIHSVTSDARFIVLNYGNRRQVEQLAERSPVPVRIVDQRKAYIPTKDFDMSDRSGKAWLQLARAVLFNG
ncbi:Transcription-repair-coupling factor [Crateriforma conspicua]|uniref:Transcription-repair-coupling factor n=2 Tax=Crateriforma conspicua TaxID=2527996 RepID=A0A5C5Y0K3_9PLAN|nr:transcription-repair coupling factor [Crateriforma conspicua]TWT68133.1 Transcription-repair-coupling factor [Crateriforma conspicua]